MSYRKPEAWVPSLIPHSSLLCTSRQQPSLVNSAFPMSLKSILCCLFTLHWHFLAQDHHFFPGLPCHLTFTQVCVHISPAHKHRLKNLSQLSKWLEGLWGTSSLARSLVQPSPLITFIQCFLCGQGHSIRNYEESEKLWSLPTDNLDNPVGF